MSPSASRCACPAARRAVSSSSGDTLIQLPLDGALPEEGAPIPRTSIFLSELAGFRDGFRRVFADAAAAEAYASSVRSQLTTALEGS